MYCILSDKEKKERLVIEFESEQKRRNGNNKGG